MVIHNTIMNLARITSCRKCNANYFVAGSRYGEYCSSNCEESDSHNIYLEERISELEDKITLLEKKLQLCLNKLEINDVENNH